jgi:hypothetical protein
VKKRAPWVNSNCGASLLILSVGGQEIEVLQGERAAEPGRFGSASAAAFHYLRYGLHDNSLHSTPGKPQG